MLKIFKRSSYGSKFSLEPYNFLSLVNEKITNAIYDNSLLLVEKIEDKGQKSK